MAAEAVGCAGVKTPVVTYSDDADARAAREGSTTSTSTQAETPATIITKQIRQPIGIRIERQVLEHFHFYSAQASMAWCVFSRGKGGRQHSFFCIHQK
jgi:uncharacterized protein (DUF4415 family)